MANKKAPVKKFYNINDIQFNTFEKGKALIHSLDNDYGENVEVLWVRITNKSSYITLLKGSYMGNPLTCEVTTDLTGRFKILECVE
jgi:hypothetical protein